MYTLSEFMVLFDINRNRDTILENQVIYSLSSTCTLLLKLLSFTLGCDRPRPLHLTHKLSLGPLVI
jgi:hypothetical protein